MPDGTTNQAGRPSPAPVDATGDDHSDPSDPDPCAPGETASNPVLVTLQEGLVHRVDLIWLRDRVVEAIRARPEPFGSVHVFVIDDRLMRDLHRSYLGEPDTTDVMTFDLTEREVGSPGSETPIEVEIVVCADEAARRAAELGHGLDRELLLYAVHGLLHCVGMSDHTESGAAAMHEEEDRILRAIGVGATYQPGDAARRMRT